MPNKAGELPQGLGRGTAGRDRGPGPEIMKRVIVRAGSRLTCASETPVVTCPVRGTHFSAGAMLIYLERPASALAPFHQEPTAPKDDSFPLIWECGGREAP